MVCTGNRVRQQLTYRTFFSISVQVTYIFDRWKAALNRLLLRPVLLAALAPVFGPPVGFVVGFLGSRTAELIVSVCGLVSVGALGSVFTLGGVGALGSEGALGGDGPSVEKSPSVASSSWSSTGMSRMLSS